MKWKITQKVLTYRSFYLQFHASPVLRLYFARTSHSLIRTSHLTFFSSFNFFISFIPLNINNVVGKHNTMQRCVRLVSDELPDHLYFLLFYTTHHKLNHNRAATSHHSINFYITYYSLIACSIASNIDVWPLSRTLPTYLVGLHFGSIILHVLRQLTTMRYCG